MHRTANTWCTDTKMPKCQQCSKKVPLAFSVAFACLGCKAVHCTTCRTGHRCVGLESAELAKALSAAKIMMESKTTASKLEKA